MRVQFRRNHHWLWLGNIQVARNQLSYWCHSQQLHIGIIRTQWVNQTLFFLFFTQKMTQTHFHITCTKPTISNNIYWKKYYLFYLFQWKLTMHQTTHKVLQTIYQLNPNPLYPSKTFSEKHPMGTYCVENSIRKCCWSSKHLSHHFIEKCSTSYGIYTHSS